MGILFYAENLTSPSVLWMRRMLEGFGREVATVATESDPGSAYRSRWNVVVVKDSGWRRWWGALNRLRLVDTIPKTRRATAQLRSAIEADEVSVVLVHYLTSAVYYGGLWNQVSKPTFVYCHGYDVTWDLRLPHEPHRLAHGKSYARQVRSLAPHVQFIANSEWTKQQLLELGISESRVRVNILGVPVPSAPPPARPCPEDLTVLYLGNLIDTKGPDLVIRAFETAVARGFRGRLRIAGDGPLRGLCESLRRNSACADRIELLGAVDAARGDSLRREAHVFTAHHRKGPVSRQIEALGVSIMEAMAAGLPIVAGRSGGVPEIVVDREQGFLVDPGDVASHASAFLRLGADRAMRERMGRSGWQRAHERFRNEDRIADLLRILRSTADPR